MANNAQGDEQVSLCNSLKEVLDVIYCYHNKGDDSSAPNHKQKLEVLIHVKKKSQETRDGFDIFTVKVKCNQDVPFISALKDIQTSKLIRFVEQMQKHEEESHLAVRLPDKEDPTLTRTFVLWMTQGEDSGSCVLIQNETLSQRRPVDNDNLVLQLRIFMKSCVLMDEVHLVSSLLCCLKMINPLVGLCLSLEGIQGVDLDLSNNESISCESLMVSVDSKVYNNRNINDKCEWDLSRLKTFHACFEDSSNKTDCLLIFIPKCMADSSHGGDIPDKRSEIFVYDCDGLPIDMLEFCLHFHITPDCLIPLGDFQSVIRVVGTCSIAPYGMGCSVEVVRGTRLPKAIEQCDGFTVWLCFVLQCKWSCSDSTTSGSLESLKKSANQTFHKLLHVEKQDDPVQRLEVRSTRNTDDRESMGRWITDITTTLSDIYVKSTDVSFRSRVAQMVPVHTRLSMKSYLQEKLESILQTNNGSSVFQPSAPNIPKPFNEEDDWKAFPLSGDGWREGSMSPDSLDGMGMDHDWDVMDDNINIGNDDDNNNNNNNATTTIISSCNSNTNNSNSNTDNSNNNNNNNAFTPINSSNYITTNNNNNNNNNGYHMDKDNVTSYDETSGLSVTATHTQPTRFHISQYKESTTTTTTIDKSEAIVNTFHGSIDSNALTESISLLEAKGGMSLSQPTKLNLPQSQTTVNSFQDVSSTSLHGAISLHGRSGMSLSQPTGGDFYQRNEWKQPAESLTGGDFNMTSYDNVHKFKKIDNVLGQPDSNLVAKRTDLNLGPIITSNSKKVKMDNGIIRCSNSLQWKGTTDYYNQPNQSQIKNTVAIHCHDQPQCMDFIGTSIESDLTRNSERYLPSVTDHSIPDVTQKHQFSEDWFDKDDLDKWYAEL